VNLMAAEKQGLEHPEAFGLPPRPAAANSSSTKALPAPAADAAAAAAGAAGAVVSKDSKGSSGSKRSKGDAEDDDLPGQVVDMVFQAPKAATYNLSLVAMSDCWVGVDETVQVGRTESVPQMAVTAHVVLCRGAWLANRQSVCSGSSEAHMQMQGAAASRNSCPCCFIWPLCRDDNDTLLVTLLVCRICCCRFQSCSAVQAARAADEPCSGWGQGGQQGHHVRQRQRRRRGRRG
jgi:hypothetical protein